MRTILKASRFPKIAKSHETGTADPVKPIARRTLIFRQENADTFGEWRSNRALATDVATQVKAETVAGKSLSWWASFSEAR